MAYTSKQQLGLNSVCSQHLYNVLHVMRILLLNGLSMECTCLQIVHKEEVLFPSRTVWVEN